MTIAEPAVTLTDYGLVLECILFAVLLSKKRPDATSVRICFVVMFCALASAAFLGGTTHGFFGDPSSRAHHVIWTATILSLGVVAWSGWIVGIRLNLSPPIQGMAISIVSVAFVIYSLVAVFLYNDFAIAIAFYLPSTMMLFVAFVRAYVRSKHPHAILGMVGLLLTWFASIQQQLGFGLHPRWCDHNVLYHLVQAVALLFLYKAAVGFSYDRSAQR